MPLWIKSNAPAKLVACWLARCRYGSEKITDIREAAEALLAGEIYDVEQKIYSDVHLELDLFEGVRAVAIGNADGVSKIQACIYESGNFARGRID